ncbi:hypothetical protein RBB50_011792 [Rhinocladiella similis]
MDVQRMKTSLKAYCLIALALHAPFSHAIVLGSSKLQTGDPAAYLGLGDLGTIPVIDPNESGPSGAGSWDVDVGGDFKWSEPFYVPSQAQKRRLEPLEALAVVTRYGLSWETAGTCSSEVMIRDADTGEKIFGPVTNEIDFPVGPSGRRIIFGLRTYKTLGVGINCGKVVWSITKDVYHYEFGETVSEESKRKRRTHRPPIIAVKSGIFNY